MATPFEEMGYISYTIRATANSYRFVTFFLQLLVVTDIYGVTTGSIAMFIIELGTKV